MCFCPLQNTANSSLIWKSWKPFVPMTPRKPRAAKPYLSHKPKTNFAGAAADDDGERFTAVAIQAKRLLYSSCVPIHSHRNTSPTKCPIAR